MQPTLGFQRVLQRAVFHVQSSGKKEVSVANVLVAIFSEKQSHAVFLLNRQDVTRLDVVNFISHGLSKIAEEKRPTRSEAAADAERDGEARQRAREVHHQPEPHGAGRAIDPLIGRKLEVERTIEILCRRRKNNPLYVGEAGVGKTAIAEGLARLIVEGQVPEVLLRCTIYLARHGRADRRHQVPRRFREAPEGGARGAEEAARRDSVHRRDPHGHRRRRGLRRRDGCLQSDQAGAHQRRDRAASARPPTTSTAASSRRITRSRGASRRST